MSLHIKKNKNKKKNCEFQKKIALYQQKIPTNKKKCLNLDEKINLFNNKNFLLLFSTLI